jgi:DNA adenine methylase
MVRMSKVERPVLRYHGGKWKLAPWIIANMPPHQVYVEPFGGGANVLLRKERLAAEVYNDLDGRVVQVFRTLQDPEKAAQVRRRLSLTPFARAEFDSCYEPAVDEVDGVCVAKQIGERR